MISVLMPVHQANKYLVSAIDSILQQTYSNFEFLIIKDFVDPYTEKLLQKQSQRDSRIRLIDNNSCRGIVGALNTGIKFAQGEYIARMDADDISLPERFTKQLKWLDSTGYDLCGSWIRFIGEHPKLIGKDLRYPSLSIDVNFCLLYGAVLCHPTVMAKSHLFHNYLYNQDYLYSEDRELWTRLASNGFSIGNIPEILLYYRLHARQISQKYGEEQKKISLMVADIYAKRYLQDNLYKISTKLCHGKAEEYSMNNYIELATMVIETAKQKKVSQFVFTEILLNMAGRIRPLGLSNFWLLLKISRNSQVDFDYSRLIRFFLNQFNFFKKK